MIAARSWHDYSLRTAQIHYPGNLPTRWALFCPRRHTHTHGSYLIKGKGEDAFAMKNPALSLVFAALAWGLIPSETASAQNAVLAEMYGRGVHAYYCGMNDEASQYLTMAIDNGIQDPRAYYFRGIAAFAAGRTDEAAADWQAGADLEAAGGTNHMIGRSLARFQGPGRIKLEEIRQKARLNALAKSMERSKQRYGELDASEPSATAPATAPPTAIAPPPVPSDTENPFADDLAEGQPNLAADDAFEGAMNDPFPAAPGAAEPAAGAADPFGGDAGADPFGAAGDDPFGGDAGGDNPFGN